MTAPLLEIILYITKACLAASRTHLAKHIQDNPILERATPNNQVTNDAEREELKNALVATQVGKNNTSHSNHVQLIASSNIFWLQFIQQLFLLYCYRKVRQCKLS